MTQLVWYASYGSNLLKNRFLCYIQGGIPKGTIQQYIGCSDITPPIENEQIIIPHQLYFAEHSSVWEGAGVAFIKWVRDENVKTLGRMYLIKKTQFVEVVRQENARKPNDPSIDINFEATITNGFSEIQGNWYRRIIFLGTKNGYPIFTFTAQWLDRDIILNPPGVKYLKTIIHGIQETYSLSEDRIVDYVKCLAGISDHYSTEQLRRIVRKA